MAHSARHTYIWNPLPAFDTVRQDNQLGNIQTVDKFYSAAKDGTLPVKLFGKQLNFKGFQEKGIKWLICYAENDSLVEKEAALAPLDYIDVEVSAFPKGHASIATSWSIPTSQCALHTCFPGKDKTCDEYRGPVRYQLDLDQELQVASMDGANHDDSAVQQDS